MPSETALAVVRPAPSLPAPADWAHMATIAEAIYRSGLTPDHIKNAQAVLMIMLKARELGIPETVALTDISMIKGKPSCNAQLMLALIQRDHGDDALYFEETTAQHCVISYKRRSWERRLSYEYTLEDARTASLVTEGSNWKKYPKAMLRARCVSAVARMGFADTIGGMYLHEEVGLPVQIIEGEQVIDSAGALVTPPAAEQAPPPTEQQTLGELAAKRQRKAAEQAAAAPTVLPGPDDLPALRKKLGQLFTLFPDQAKAAQAALKDKGLKELPAATVRRKVAELRTRKEAEPRRLQESIGNLLEVAGGMAFDGQEEIDQARAEIEAYRRLVGPEAVVKVAAGSIGLPKLLDSLELVYGDLAKRYGPPPELDGTADEDTPAVAGEVVDAGAEEADDERPF